MNLIIDVGNTLVKLGVFQDNELFEKFSVEQSEFLSTVQASA